MHDATERRENTVMTGVKELYVLVRSAIHKCHLVHS